MAMEKKTEEGMNELQKYDHAVQIINLAFVTAQILEEPIWQLQLPI